MLRQVHAEVVGQARPLVMGGLLPFQPAGDGGVVGGRATEGLQGAATAVFQAPGASLQLLEEGAVLVRAGEHRHRGVILGGAPDHAGTADINLLDGLIEGDPLPGDGGLEGIEVDGDEIDGFDAKPVCVGSVGLEIAPEEQAPVDPGVEGLHPAVEAFWRSGVGGHLLGLQPGLLERSQRTARGQQSPAQAQ